MNGLAVLPTISLCTGIGGIELGLRLAGANPKIICSVEVEAYTIAVQIARAQDGLGDIGCLWDDVHTFDGTPWRNKVYLLTAGYPCQPFSYAGRRKGESDPRHLFPSIRRIITECSPRVCFFENVEGHLSLGFESVWRDLRDLGFTVEAGIYSAQETGAPHLRKRLFIFAHQPGAAKELADRNQGRCPGPLTRPETGPHPSIDAAGYRQAMADTNEERRRPQSNGEQPASRIDRRSVNMVNPTKPRLERRQQSKRNDGGLWYDTGAGSSELGNADNPGSSRWNEPNDETQDAIPAWPPGPANSDAWAEVLRIEAGLEPAICRVADGVPDYRMDRLAALGNAVVPAVAATAWIDLLRQANEGIG